MRYTILFLIFSILAIFNTKAQTGVCDSLIIPNVITPNNDGFNDYWVIECLEFFPDNEIQVFNRWGQIVYQAFGYDNNWDGTWDKTKGEIPEGTYVYVIKLNKKEDDKPITGSLTLIR